MCITGAIVATSASSLISSSRMPKNTSPTASAPDSIFTFPAPISRRHSNERRNRHNLTYTQHKLTIPLNTWGLSVIESGERTVIVTNDPGAGPQSTNCRSRSTS